MCLAGKKNYPVKVSGVEIVPDPVEPGNPATFKISASTGTVDFPLRLYAPCLLILLTAVGVLSSSWVFYSAMNLAHVLRTTKVISNHQSNKFVAGLTEFSYNFPRLFKFVGVLVPLGAVAGCNFLCMSCTTRDWDFPDLFIFTVRLTNYQVLWGIF